MPKKILITGGMRSGKSRYAQELALAFDESRLFVATAEALDDEMKLRIKQHQKDRGQEFKLLEEPVDLVGALKRYPENPSVVLVDCMSLWVSNLLHRYSSNKVNRDKKIQNWVSFVEEAQQDIFIVTNEVGLGMIPNNPLGRKYLDHLGFLNQSLARVCDEVIFMVSGIPQFLKGKRHEIRVDSNFQTN